MVFAVHFHWIPESSSLLPRTNDEGTIDKSESESAQLFTKITLRATRESDLQTFFEYQLDPIANRMAAFTAKDPTDRDAYMTKWRKNLGDPTNITKTIMIGDQIVGTIA